MALSWRLIWLFLKAPGMAVTQRCRQSFLPLICSKTSLRSHACTAPEVRLHAAASERASVAQLILCNIELFQCLYVANLKLSNFQTPRNSPAIPFLVPEMDLCKLAPSCPSSLMSPKPRTLLQRQCATSLVQCACLLHCLKCLSHTPCVHPRQGYTCCPVAVQVSSKAANA